MRALYDLSDNLTSFNFFEWLIQAKGKGATKVVFDIQNIRGDKWSKDHATERFWSICYPGPPLAGLETEVWAYGDPRAEDIAKPGGLAIVNYWKSGAPFHRLKSVQPPVDVEYTVTLRKTIKGRESVKYRDSDEKVWRDFADEIGAVVIEDYEVKPIHLHDRMALYSGAKMNFFVSNGPGILCSFTEYPCMLFNTIHAAKAITTEGIPWGGQYPWMLENQRTIWEIATPDSLRRHFHHWKQHGTFAASPA